MKLAFTRALILIAVLAGVSQGHAQLGVPWPRTPTIVVISAEGDPRLRLVDEALSFWNKTLEEIGSGFRLGPAGRLVQPIPEEACSPSVVPFSRLSAGPRPFRRRFETYRATSRSCSPTLTSSRSAAHSTRPGSEL